VAAALRLPGTVVLRLVIDEAGKVVDAQVVQKAKPFTEAARKCVETWRYRPATRGGIPIRVSLEVPITFRPPP
jgi:protein TonB